jgi:hypothetical protein
MPRTSPSLYSLLALFPIVPVCDALLLHPYESTFSCMATIGRHGPTSTRRCQRAIRVTDRTNAMAIIHVLATATERAHVAQLLERLQSSVFCASHDNRPGRFGSRELIRSWSQILVERERSLRQGQARVLRRRVDVDTEDDCGVCWEGLEGCKAVVWCVDSCGHAIHGECWQNWRRTCTAAVVCCPFW